MAFMYMHSSNAADETLLNAIKHLTINQIMTYKDTILNVSATRHRLSLHMYIFKTTFRYIYFEMFDILLLVASSYKMRIALKRK
jgi:hypothetical protein